MTKRYEVTGLGNAIVDVIARADDTFLATHAINKGGMTLIDEARAHALYAALGPAQEVSGGSAGNTMAGFASFGGKGAYMGKVADDQLGKTFAHDIRAIGVDFHYTPLTNGPATARCMIVVTPDAQRSMNTYLGACVEFSESDVDENVIADSAIIYLEGYLFDKDTAKAAYLKATRAAHLAGTRVALTLSDSFCCMRHRDDFKKLIADETDILFANEAEILALYETKNLDDAIALVRTQCDLVAITRSEKGSIIVTPDRTIEIPAHPVENVVDTTGAGDQFAAGFLFGLAKGFDLSTCGALGSLAAAEVISHIGPRPEKSLADLSKSILQKAA